jgi:hypothetical protein
MESRLLDDLPHDVTKALSAYICSEQTLKAPFVRKHGNLDALTTKWSAWLEMQDIPTTIIPRTGSLPIKMAKTNLHLPLLDYPHPAIPVLPTYENYSFLHSAPFPADHQ